MEQDSFRGSARALMLTEMIEWCHQTNLILVFCFLSLFPIDGLPTGDKPHACELCNKRFALACNLRAHMKTHEGTSRKISSSN